jgi:pimeloyl-ACP methyl ester carboxylesterase
MSCRGFRAIRLRGDYKLGLPVAVFSQPSAGHANQYDRAVPFLTTPDGVRLKYEIEGDGPPLLLHLGAGCDSGLWRAAGYIEPLAGSYKCILFDHRGHGESDKPAGSEANHVDRYVADVLSLLNNLGIEKAAFWAYSNGISVGVKLADAHPNRVGALIGSGVIGKPVSHEVLAERAKAAVAELQEFGWDKMISDFDEQETEPVPLWMKERIRATDLGQIMGWNRGRTSWNWSAWDSLPRVAAPTLFLVGELEDPDDVMAEAAARMRNATRMRVQGLGHINAFIRSKLVLPRATAFLAENVSRH